MKEHHVEKAFREHAEKRRCSEFEMARKEHPDLGPLHKFATGQGDLTVEGQYKWCGRKFQFTAELNTDGVVGWVCVQAYTNRALLVNDLPTVCSLTKTFVGFGTVIEKPSIPGRESDGYFFWGINVRVGDLEFTELTVNVICASLLMALEAFEDKLGLESAHSE